jgi:hypothetical protein
LHFCIPSLRTLSTFSFIFQLMTSIVFPTLPNSHFLLPIHHSIPQPWSLVTSIVLSTAISVIIVGLVAWKKEATAVSALFYLRLFRNTTYSRWPSYRRKSFESIQSNTYCFPWPTVVVEVGVSGLLRKLRADAAWWFADSHLSRACGHCVNQFNQSDYHKDGVALQPPQQTI